MNELDELWKWKHNLTSSSQMVSRAYAGEIMLLKVTATFIYSCYLISSLISTWKQPFSKGLLYMAHTLMISFEKSSWLLFNYLKSSLITTNCLLAYCPPLVGTCVGIVCNLHIILHIGVFVCILIPQWTLHLMCV